MLLAGRSPFGCGSDPDRRRAATADGGCGCSSHSSAGCMCVEKWGKSCGRLWIERGSWGRAATRCSGWSSMLNGRTREGTRQTFGGSAEGCGSVSVCESVDPLLLSSVWMSSNNELSDACSGGLLTASSASESLLVQQSDSMCSSWGATCGVMAAIVRGACPECVLAEPALSRGGDDASCSADPATCLMLYEPYVQYFTASGVV